MRNFYAVMAVAGTIIPWIFFVQFMAENGTDLQVFIQGLYANGAAGGFSSDVLISAVVFWVWSWRDAQSNAISRWWIVVPATLFVGLSLAFPLYLWMREGASTVHQQPQTA